MSVILKKGVSKKGVKIWDFSYYPGGLRPDRRTHEVSKQSVAFVVMLWNVELFALIFFRSLLFFLLF